MAVRLSVLDSLEKQGYLPSDANYDYHVKLFLVKEFRMENRNEKESALLNSEVSKFSSKVESFYFDKKIGNREINRLRSKKKVWLSIQIENPVQNKSKIPKVKPKLKKKKKKPGRPKKDYLKTKCRSKKSEKASNTKGDHCLEELIHAALLRAHNEGQSDVTWVLRQLLNNPDEGASKFRKAMKHFNLPDVVVFTPEEALALIIELRLSRRGYMKLRVKAKNKHAHIYPAYDPAVTDYMKKCKPPNIDLSKSDEVKVPMQSTLDFQTLNVLELPSVVTKHNDLKEQCRDSGLDYELKFFFKYGADGTSNQSQYQNVSAGL